MTSDRSSFAQLWSVVAASNNSTPVFVYCRGNGKISCTNCQYPKCRHAELVLMSLHGLLHASSDEIAMADLFSEESIKELFDTGPNYSDSDESDVGESIHHVNRPSR
jgi:hypothetical protein